MSRGSTPSRPGIPDSTSGGGHPGDRPVADAMSVSELTGHLKAVIEQTFPAVWVSGEISDLARPRSGHLYFTLKDDHSQIRAVIWRSTAARLRFQPEDGQLVVCHGDIELYAARGTYQLVARKIQPQGLGGLQLAFQQLQAKLQAEGLFAAERKRRLPRFPRRIAVITSPTGAAIRDFLQAAAERWPGGEIVVIPAQVQGDAAPSSIVAAMQAVHRLRPRPDLVILTRGGGSMEDLWSFNDERVVRAVAASEIPTVSAVGHEIDVTLCDFAADVRALTPTDAAARTLPDGAAVRQTLAGLRDRGMHAMRNAIRHRRQQLEWLEQRPMIRSPFEIIHDRSRLLDELDQRCGRAVEQRLRDHRRSVERLAASLSALSPLSVLARGYSVTADAAGAALTDSREVVPGSTVTTRLHRGSLVCRVEETKP